MYGTFPAGGADSLQLCPELEPSFNDPWCLNIMCV